MRLDRWLWTARIFKTRPLAAEAVSGGRVHVNGQPAKPSRDVRPGDELAITKGPVRLTVIVTALAERRGPAKEAALLYEETEESRTRREALTEQRRLAAQVQPDFGGRPTKRDRRRFDRTRNRGR